MGPFAVAALLLTVQSPYDSVYDQIKDLAPRRDAAAHVRGVVLRRDVFELRLDSGTAYLLTPVRGRTIGIAFVGAGSMTFEPPTGVERFNLRRVLGDSVLTGAITAAVFIFADSTDAELARTLQFSAAASGDDARGHVGEALEYLMDTRYRSVDPTLMTALLNGTTSAYFSAYVQRQRGESVLMQFEPTESEEVLLFRRGKMVGQRVETVCQFQRIEDLEGGVSVASERPEPLEVVRYDIDATIDGNYKFAARTTMRLTVRRDSHQWARLLLYSELDVDSVTTDAGVPLAYHRRDRTTPLWVRFGRPLQPGDTVTVRVVYHGGLIGFGSAMEGMLPPWWDARMRDFPVLDQWAFIKSTTTWYPRYSYVQMAPVTLTFHTPRDLKVASIGRLVSSETDRDITTTRWECDLPTNQVSFNIGEFKQLDIRDPRIPPVTVHVNAEAHRSISRFIPHARNPEDHVAADVANSLAFFSGVFGPPLFSQYYATEIPYFHGQAFPGMIHLSWWTFLSMSTKGSDEAFRAHEMAHQWWGIGVEPASYRDAWIAEGFSEFAGLWYMQLILNDNDKYFKVLREARDEIRRSRERAAPIGLGYRAAESWRGNYDLIIYQKGAWVLHMLRNMMIDTRTMSEERFTAMMRDFYGTYRGKRASTLDFQRVVEKHIGRSMDWFFEQWVEGTAIPTYTFSWTAEPASGTPGQYTARIRVRQSDVPEHFGMFVPLLIKFAEGEAWVSVLVRGATTEATLALPAEPQDMELSPLESVLAELKTEDWR